MTSAEVAQWGMLALAMVGMTGGVIGYLIKQSSRQTTTETEVRQLRELVDRNAKMVHELAVQLSGISEKLQMMIDMERN